jgi:hypothetical protein
MSEFKECDVCGLRLWNKDTTNRFQYSNSWVTVFFSYGTQHLKEKYQKTFHICTQCFKERLPEMAKMEDD